MCNMRSCARETSSAKRAWSRRLRWLRSNSSLAEPALLHGEQGDEIWEVWLAASKLSLVLDQCIATAEPAYLAKHTFQLAQLFNNFYHRHHILTEQDPERKRLLLATAAVVERSLVRGLDWLGIAAPERMSGGAQRRERNAREFRP